MALRVDLSSMRKAIFVPVLVFPLILLGPSATAVEPPVPRVMQSLTAGAAVHEVLPLDLPSVSEVPSLREELLAAALAQLGATQDCTDLVQNSLATLGLTQRRDQGGPDYGVQQLARFGTPVDPADALPGDIAITGPDNGGHVWVVLDPATNEGVHGGWAGLNTAKGVYGVPLDAHLVVRVG